MLHPPIRTYKSENLEKFFEDIAEEYGYSSANVAKFHAAHALIKQKEIKEKFKFLINKYNKLDWA